MYRTDVTVNFFPFSLIYHKTLLTLLISGLCWKTPDVPDLSYIELVSTSHCSLQLFLFVFSVC